MPKLEVPRCGSCDWFVKDVNQCHFKPVSFHGWPSCSPDEMGCCRHSELERNQPSFTFQDTTAIYPEDNLDAIPGD